MGQALNVVGLTGGIGSGKSTVARLFAEHGIHWVDADDVAREVVEPGTPALAAIAEHFGSQILQTDGSLDRASLRSLVFDQEEERRWLEQLLHPIIREELAAQLQPANYSLPYTLLVSPLLLETDQHELVDRIIVIDVPVSEQIARTSIRDNNSEEQVRKIIAAQMLREEKLARGDHVIDNARGMEHTREQVEALHQRLLEDFKG